MKRILQKILLSVSLMVMMAIPEVLRAQEPEPCDITCNETMPVCSETVVTLSVPQNPLYTYSWTPGNHHTSSITVKPFSTTTYHVYVTDTAGVAVCDNSFTVEVLPRFQTSMRQFRLTCTNDDNDNGRTAQVRVDVSGGEPPYTYEWREKFGNSWGEYPLGFLHVSPDNPSVAIGLKAHKWYRVEITDSRGCTQYDSIHTRAFPTPVVEIFCDPSDTLYLQNPDATFSFLNHSEDTLAIDHFFWTFEQVGQEITTNQETPVFTYVEEGPTTVSLTVYDDLGCDTVFIKEIYVNPVKLKIPSVFTPNGDGINDTFVITLASGSDNPNSNSTRANSGERPLNDYYKSTDLMVMNRWGRVVYHSTDYQNDWDGGGLADGTYFYVLKCRGLKEEVQYQGSVMILTRSRQ